MASLRSREGTSPLYEANLVIPDYGFWYASVRGDFDLLAGDAVELDILGQTFVGYLELSRAEVRHQWGLIYPGVGGYNAVLGFKQYDQIPLNQLVKSMLSETGEKLNSKSVLLTSMVSWCRLEGTLAQQLNRLGLRWRVLPDGSLVIGDYRPKTVGSGYIKRMEADSSREIGWLEEDAFIFPGTVNGRSISRITYIDVAQATAHFEIEYAD